VDALAKQGTTRTHIDPHYTPETHDHLRAVDEYTQLLWQRTYDASNTGSFYRNIEPVVSTNVKFKCSCRAKERLITRLRLGKCKLHKYLHDIKKHPSGHCDECHVPETIEHFLLECAYNGMPEALYAKCTELGIQPTIVEVLKNADTVQLIYTLVTTMKRAL
jgi:hypothetical protein